MNEWVEIFYFMTTECVDVGDLMIECGMGEIRKRKTGEAPTLIIHKDLFKDKFVSGEIVPCLELYKNDRLTKNIIIDGIHHYIGTHRDAIEKHKLVEKIIYDKIYTGELI